MPRIYVYDGSVKSISISATGEVTIDSFTDNLTSGIKVIIVNIHAYLGADNTSLMYFELYRDTTVLDNEESRTHRLTAGNLGYNSVWQLIAVDTNAPANATYTVKAYVTYVKSATWSFEIKAMVILVDFADIAYGGVTDIASGSTTTVISKTVTLDVGKYVIVMRVHPEYVTGGADKLVGANNLRLKIAGSTVASNEYPVRTYSTTQIESFAIVYLHNQTSSGSVTIAIEAYNDSEVSMNFYGRFIIFNVYDGFFLDTGSVALSTTQTTIANLSTTFPANSEIGVLPVIIIDNQTTTAYDFSAGNIVLQENNSTTNQVATELPITYMWSAVYGRNKAVILPGRYVPTTNNPSYQIKATAPATGLYGETKMVVFISIYKITLTETMSFSDVTLKRTTREFVETIYLTDKVFRVAPAQRIPVSPTRTLKPVRIKKPDRVEKIT